VEYLFLNETEVIINITYNVNIYRSTPAQPENNGGSPSPVCFNAATGSVQVTPQGVYDDPHHYEQIPSDKIVATKNVYEKLRKVDERYILQLAQQCADSSTGDYITVSSLHSHS
jgi:hypothetical protein